jgi:hypothetical protein
MKSATDIVDQRIGAYTVATKSRRWTTPAIAYVLDTARVNAGTVWQMNKNENPRAIISFDFALELAMGLVKPHIQARPRNGLTKAIQKKIDFILETNRQVQPIEDIQRYPGTGTKRRCNPCLEQIAGPGNRERKNALAKQSKQCQSCAVAVCSAHTLSLCPECTRRVEIRDPGAQGAAGLQDQAVNPP